MHNQKAMLKAGKQRIAQQRVADTWTQSDKRASKGVFLFGNRCPNLCWVVSRCRNPQNDGIASNTPTCSPPPLYVGWACFLAPMCWGSTCMTAVSHFVSQSPASVPSPWNPNPWNGDCSEENDDLRWPHVLKPR